jgi:hypothetical protein
LFFRPALKMPPSLNFGRLWRVANKKAEIDIAIPALTYHFRIIVGRVPINVKNSPWRASRSRQGQELLLTARLNGTTILTTDIAERNCVAAARRGFLDRRSAS